MSMSMHMSIGEVYVYVCMCVYSSIKRIAKQVMEVGRF